MPIVPAPHPIVIPTDWEEMAGSPTEHRGFMQASATMRLKGPWKQRYYIIDHYVNKLVAYPHQTHGGSGVSADQAIRAISGSSKPFGAATGVIEIPGGSINVYAFALVEIQYGVPKIGVPILTLVSGDRSRGDVISETFEPWTEYQSLPAEQFKWASGEQTDLTEQEAPSFPVNGMDYLFTRHGSITIPSIAWETGIVNNEQIKALTPPMAGILFPAETMLYKGMRAQRSADRNMAVTRMSVTYRFSIRRTGWNKFYRADTGEYDRIIHRETSRAHKNFPLRDFEAF